MTTPQVAFKLTTIAALSAASLVVLSPAAHAYRVFVGEDLNNNPRVPLSSFVNARAAEAAFLANLVDVGTETFEGSVVGTRNLLELAFPGAGTARLSGAGVVSRVAPGTTNGVGRYGISGSQFWEVDAGGRFSIAFSEQVAAFGFYGVDLGDFGGQLTLTLTGGRTQQILVPNTIGQLGSTDGSVLFFGLIAESIEEAFNSVSFAMSTGQGDVFAFDNMTVGGLAQVKSPEPTQSTPEPGAIAGLGAIGAFGLGSLGRRGRRTLED